MTDDRTKTPRQRVIARGKIRVRRPHNACSDWSILVRTPEDEEYTPEVAGLVPDRAASKTPKIVRHLSVHLDRHRSGQI